MDESDALYIAGGALLFLLLLLFMASDSAMACKTVVSIVQCAAIIYAIRQTGSAWCLFAMLSLAVIW